MSDLQAVRVVLVRPHYAGNIGAVARLMSNFGLTDLVLVDPVASLVDHDARRLATHGISILESARVVPTLMDSIADCVATLATGGLADGVKRKSVYGTPREKLPFLVDAMTSGTAALVFGPEPHGLTTAEIGMCHGMIHIPTSPDHSSLNLSQAVAVCLYELFQLTTDSHRLRKKNLASHEELDRMLGHLRESFEAIHYVYGQKGDQLMHGFRHVILRAQPTTQEVRMLHGLARQLLYLAGHTKVKPTAEELGETPPAPE
ncbi:MAG: RNA methyltransferase [Gemmataceae bacterium]